MTTYQKLESQPDTSSDPVINEDPTHANPEKPSPNGQEPIIGQVVSRPSQPLSHPFPAGNGPQTMTSHTSATSYQYPINPGAPQYPVNPRYYELANFQTASQGQPPAYDPEIGLNNQTNPSSSQLLSYHEIHRAGNPACWRPFVGLLALGCGVSVVGAIVVAFIFAFICGLSNKDFDPEAELNPLTPAMLTFLNLVLICGIPVSCFLSKQFHGIPYGWLASVQGRMRWSWFKICLGLSFIVLLATFLVSEILGALTSSELDTAGTDEIHVNEWTETTTGFVMVILLLTPFQAAAEEYGFRGYLTQAFGGIFPKWAAVLIPSFLFALAHGLDQTGPIFLDRLAFGLVSGLLVVKTGGLEAGIAMHILNNIYAFFLALMFGDITAAMEPTSDNWWGILVTMTQSVGYFVLTVTVAKRKNIQTTVSKGEVEGQRNQVNGFYSVPL